MPENKKRKAVHHLLKNRLCNLLLKDVRGRSDDSCIQPSCSNTEFSANILTIFINCLKLQKFMQLLLDVIYVLTHVELNVINRIAYSLYSVLT